MEKIAPETLRDWLEDREVFIIDLRNPTAWTESSSLIRGAHRYDPHQVQNWSMELPRDRKLVLY